MSGRKPKPLKSHQVSIRLDPARYAKLKSEATLKGKTVSEIIKEDIVIAELVKETGLTTKN